MEVAEELQKEKEANLELRQSLYTEKESTLKLQSDVAEAKDAIMKEHVSGFFRAVKQIQHFNPDADYSQVDVDKDFNKDGIMVPLSLIEDEEETGQEEEEVEEQAAEEGGDGEGEIALPDPSFVVPPGGKDDLGSTPVGTAAHGDAHE